MLNLRDIYWQMIIVLSILTAIGVYSNGISNTLPQVFISVVVAAVIDYPIKLYMNRKIEFPKSAVITGLIIAQVLAPNQPWYVPTIAAIIAIASKHLIKIKGKHIFNPANFALTIMPLIFFSAQQAWWGSTNLYALVILGLFIVWRLRALPLVISFLVPYFLIFAGASVLRGGTVPYNLFMDTALLYFAFLMLTEHKTYPLIQKGRIIFGVLVAVFAGIFQVTGLFSYITIGLVLADIFVPLINKYVY